MPEAQKYQHHMYREILENPDAVRNTLAGRVSLDGIDFSEGRLHEEKLRRLTQVHILASGTSRHAGLAGKIMLQELAGVHVDVEYASEFAYANPATSRHELTILITQSGETADTLAAQAVAAGAGSHTLAICNVPDATLARRADSVLYTRAGTEVAIASTKAFTAQMALLFAFAVYLGKVRGFLSETDARLHANELLAIPEKIARTLNCNSICEQIAEKYFIAPDFLFLGRSVHFPVALDGALKLKETSYIHAEGYPSGELKHGPYALIDSMMPIVFLAGCDRSDEGSVTRYKVSLQNMRDIRERMGRVIAIAVDGCDEVAAITNDVIFIPSASELLLPLLEIVPLQLLAYHVALRRGVDVDSPRNLVKSVTVE
ncbi:MAG TPA: isomerizing glutamine--fructose-6-phosphate transaminase [Candidatus Acidoferrales bacterium]|nr:isomerizing glutamine--fructose-6-phosphate transaminase [Candidatus Acidoferrales bacterium]